MNESVDNSLRVSWRINNIVLTIVKVVHTIVRTR